MWKFAIALTVVASAGCALAANIPSGNPHPDAELYGGWLNMYDLKFDDAHRGFAAWKQSHPEDALGPVSDAAAYLFSELARLGVLESELFVDDSRFEHRPKLRPDVAKKAQFNEQVSQAERLADAALQKSAADPNALFVKSLTFGLRADNAALLEKRSLTALSFTKEGRTYSERLLQAYPQAFDAYLGPGIENYLLSLKPGPLRLLLRVTGSSIDREKGIEELRQTAYRGYYLEPFAKLLLAVAALRDKNPSGAKDILAELHRRFPDNELYTRELNQIEQTAY
ncbi:MAG TPA: hypothetical protein VK789_11675 [Bryobacteraceae bacterium]|nr:hypothetical protein [Bryobacteraceae bacterium]